MCSATALLPFTKISNIYIKVWYVFFCGCAARKIRLISICVQNVWLCYNVSQVYSESNIVKTWLVEQNKREREIWWQSGKEGHANNKSGCRERIKIRYVLWSNKRILVWYITAHYFIAFVPNWSVVCHHRISHVLQQAMVSAHLISNTHTHTNANVSVTIFDRITLHSAADWSQMRYEDFTLQAVGFSTQTKHRHHLLAPTASSFS